MRKRNNKILHLYRSLLKKHGKPGGQWKLWCKRPKKLSEKEEVIIEAILTQQANWKNVELAIANLKKVKVCSIKKIRKTSKKRLSGLIRPSGFYNQKTGYLLGLASFILKECGSVAKMEKEKITKLREDLLSQKGIGKETADSILLYALDKPVFVIDEYTKRLAKNHRLTKILSYDNLQKLFKNNIPRNYRLYQDFHALIVINGKNKKHD